MRATDEQINRVTRCLPFLMDDADKAALAAVLSELAALREESRINNQIIDSVFAAIRNTKDTMNLAKNIHAALAACKETTAKQLATKER